MIKKHIRRVDEMNIFFFSYSEVNDLLAIFNKLIYDGDSAIIDQKFIDKVKKDYYHGRNADLVEKLIGYEVCKEVDGTHKNDSQMVEYDFTIISPSGFITSIVTEMCLMVGFNTHDDLEFSNI